MSLYINEIGIRLTVANPTPSPATPTPAAPGSPATPDTGSTPLDAQAIKAIVSEATERVLKSEARGR